MTIRTPFGHPFRAQFPFSHSFTPLNHGSFGAYPSCIQAAQNSFQDKCHSRPDTWIIYSLPSLIDDSRVAVAPLLGAHIDEVVLIPNATTGVNTVLRNLKWEAGDVVVHFSTIYDACEKTLDSIKEHESLETVNIKLVYPIRDDEIVRLLEETIEKVKSQGKKVRLAMFDTVLTFPGARMPWEQMVKLCRKSQVLSLIDGAHGIGHIDLRHLGAVGPDFFVSNCHKWLYTPRSVAVFYVPFRNQHLLRTSIPTSHGYQPIHSIPDIPKGSTPFTHLFEFVATLDYTPYLCIPAALEFRKRICGGEDAIRTYSFDIAQSGGKKVADILKTDVMGDGFSGSEMHRCCFTNVRLPLKFTNKEEVGKGTFGIEDAGRIGKWINFTAVKEFDTYLQVAFHANAMWVRLSGQVYLELSDFEWVAWRLKELCERVERGEVRK